MGMMSTSLGKPRDVRLHVREGLGDYQEVVVTLLLKEKDGPYGVDTWQVNLNGAADLLGHLERCPDVRQSTTYAGTRIRRDFARRTLWRSYRRDERPTPGLYEDTRTDALAYLLNVSRGDVHMPGRPAWRRCNLCESA